MLTNWSIVTNELFKMTSRAIKVDSQQLNIINHARMKFQSMYQELKLQNGNIICQPISCESMSFSAVFV